MSYSEHLQRANEIRTLYHQGVGKLLIAEQFGVNRRTVERIVSGRNCVKTIEEMFWEKVDRNGPVIRKELGNCWIWTGTTIQSGYGIFLRGKIYVHRFSWELVNGKIPDGLNVCHHCDNPPCVRESHLFLGTDADNCRDKIIKGRWDCGRKLTWEQVQEIRSLYLQGVSQAQIALRFGCNPSNISRIITWKTRREK